MQSTSLNSCIYLFYFLIFGIKRGLDRIFIYMKILRLINEGVLNEIYNFILIGLFFNLEKYLNRYK